MQNKWSKISNFCIERNNYWISRYVVADGANRYILWDGNKMIKIHDNAKALKDEAERLDSNEKQLAPTNDLFGRANRARQASTSYDQRKG